MGDFNVSVTLSNKYVHCVKVVPDIQVTSSIVKQYCMHRAVNEYLQFIVSLLALISSYDYKLRVVNSSNYHYILMLTRDDEITRISVNLYFSKSNFVKSKKLRLDKDNQYDYSIDVDECPFESYKDCLDYLGSKLKVD